MDKKSLLIEHWKESFNFRELELNAFLDVKREDFIPKELRSSAYEDIPLPLLRGKTISQPTTVMIMTTALMLELGHNVLEVGTGSGYQTAIIAKIIGNKGSIISTEVVPELVVLAKKNLGNAGITNVRILEEDGSKGYIDNSPYDRIIITAACKEFPKHLLEQLKPNGIIVGPVGDKYEQEMVRGVKDEKGKLQLEFLGQFIFSPLYGKYGFED